MREQHGRGESVYDAQPPEADAAAGENFLAAQIDRREQRIDNMVSNLASFNGKHVGLQNGELVAATRRTIQSISVESPERYDSENTTGKPKDIDARTFFTMINQLHHARDHLLLCVCNSGRRSLYAAQLLRSMGYRKALSVAGGFQAWKKLQAARTKLTKTPSLFSIHKK